MRTATAAVAVTVMALGLSGCGLGERLLEEGVEQGAEQLTGGEIDVDDEGVSFESDEGSFSADADGQVNIETKDGSFSSGAELPDDFPSSVPLPDDGERMNAARVDTDDGIAWTVQYQYDAGDPGDALQAAVDALLDAGFSPPEGQENSFSMEDGSGGGMGGQFLENDDYTVNVSTIGEPDDFILGIQVFEQPQE